MMKSPRIGICCHAADLLRTPKSVRGWKPAVKWRFTLYENIARTTDDRVDRMPGVKDAIDAVARNRFIILAL
jgi:hypothetical protein